MNKAFFLDRDGVINENRKNYVRTPDDFVFLPKAAEAIRMINQAGWLVVIVTNQSMINRGVSSEENYQAITRKMVNGLGEEGAKLDGIYHCPNHPDDNAPCRKPNPGMLLKAAEDLEIDISASIMVGDMFTDLEAGKRAGTKRQELVTNGRSLFNIVKEILDSYE